MRHVRLFLWSLSLFLGLLLIHPFNLKPQEHPLDSNGEVSRIAPDTMDQTTMFAIVFADDFETDPQDRWQVQVRGSASGPTGIEQTIRYEASAGNPGGFRAMTHSIDGNGNLLVAHVYTAQPYVPSEQGAIASLNYHEDRISLDGRSVGSRVVVWQGGQAHIALLSTFRDQGWTTETAQGLTAEDFTPVPDFSASGDTLWFGYERANTNTSANAVQQREHGIDNWEIEVFSASDPGPGLSCILEPQNATKVKGQEHTVTVTITADGTPLAEQTVTMDVTSGPNSFAIKPDTLTTDVGGQASFTYTGDSDLESGVGMDIITAAGVYEGESFSCTAQIMWTNTAPVANNDWFVLVADSIPDVQGFQLDVLANDFDPDGDAFEIFDFTQPVQIGSGTVDNGVFLLFYTPDTRTSDIFTYTIEELPGIPGITLSDDAEVTVLIDCGCTTECISAPIGKAQQSNTIDLDLLRRTRDELFRPTEHGARYTDFYYTTTPEIARILILDQPELGAQAVRMIEQLQPALRNMLDGDGSELITQTQIDSAAAFFANLSAAGSDSLEQLITDELARLGPLDDYVGQPVRDVLTSVLGEPVGTAIEEREQPTLAEVDLNQNFPNPFRYTTEIRYVLSRPTSVRLTVYDLQGRRIRTLVERDQEPGIHSVTWNGLDEAGLEVASGVYLFHLQTPSFEQTKTMIYRK